MGGFDDVLGDVGGDNRRQVLAAFLLARDGNHVFPDLLGRGTETLAHADAGFLTGDHAAVTFDRHETEMAFKAARGAVDRVERRLDGGRPAAAHRHDKRRVAVPSGGQHTAGGEGFLHRRDARIFTVAALGERFAGGVDVDDQLAVYPVDEDGGTVCFATGIGAAATLVADAIDDRVFGGERWHAGVAHGFIAHHAVDREVAVDVSGFSQSIE